LDSGETPAGPDAAELLLGRCGALSGRAYAARSAQFARYWKEHLDRCRTLVREGIAKVARKTGVTVIGVSEARDVPLQELAEAFDTINLVDIDEPSMRGALDALRRSDRTGTLAAKVRCFVQDITGGRFARLAAEIFRRISTSVAPADALSGISETCDGYAPSVPDQLVGPLKGSYVISSGVATQFVPMLLAGITETMREAFPRWSFNAETDSTLAPVFEEFRQKLLGQHAATLAALAEADGLIFWWDTVAQAPSWSRASETELLALSTAIADFVRGSRNPALTGADFERLTQNGGNPRNVLEVLSRLLRANLLPVQEATALIRTLAERAEELGAGARQVFISGGLAAYCQGLPVRGGPTHSWRWFLNPPELSSLQVEAIHLRRPYISMQECAAH
jgi:hypothetical protein